MNKMRYIIGVLFCFSYLWGYAQRFTYTYDGIDFKCKVKSGTVCITGFDRNAATVVIPNRVVHKGRQYDVTEVDTYISGDNYSTVSLTLEEGIKYVTNYSFVEFRKLETVILPESIIKIGKKTFADAGKINKFYASERVKDIVMSKRDSSVESGSDWYSPSEAKGLFAEKEVPQQDVPERQIPLTDEERSQALGAEPNEPLSDVDMNIPKLSKSNEYCFAVIIANEAYEEEEPVEFALRDGRMFKEYCEKVLGLPQENIRLVENASFMKIKRTLDWLEKVAEAYSGICKVLFYYTGHGVPDEKLQAPYLLPVDGYASDMSTGYSLNELYESLGKLSAKSVTVFLDACFSGSKRDGSALVAARGVAIKPRVEQLKGNVMVFSATTNDETAYPYKERGHGLFTYFLLKKLKQTQGKVSYGELADYLKTEVRRKSITLNSKWQSPTVQVSPAMKEKWQNIGF